MTRYIFINGKAYEYEYKHITYDNVTTIDFEIAKNILFTTKKLFDEKNIHFFLMFGTLLGAIREHNFISHDYDIDIVTDDFDKMLCYIPEWYRMGFKICRHNDDLVSFMMDGFYIDVYKMQPAKGLYKKWCVHIDEYIMPSHFFKSFEAIDFLGKEFLVPANPVSLIEWMYGKDWRTPKPDGRGRYDVFLFDKEKKLRIWAGSYFGKKHRRLKKMKITKSIRRLLLWGNKF